MDEPLNDPRLSQINNPRPSKGHLLLMPVQPGSGRYRYFGVKSEVYEWLIANVGRTGTYRAWEDDDQTLRWLHTGCNNLSRQMAEQIGYPMVVKFLFRDPKDAMLMKLVWSSRM